MGGLIILGIVIAALVVFDILALRNGEDSRPEFGASPTPNGFRIV
jgi:hypothetical protein